MPNSKYRWILLLTFSIYTSYTYFLCFSYSPLIPIIVKELGTTFGGAGLLATAYFVAYAAMQIPAGLISDSWSVKKVMFASFCLLAFSSLLFPYSTDLISGITLRALMGIGASFVFVPAFKILANWFSSTERATAFSIFASSSFVGTFATQILIPYLLPLYNGNWRSELFVVALPALLLPPSSLLLIREWPKSINRPQTKIDFKQARALVVGVFGNRNLWRMIISVSILFGTIFSVLTWMPSYLASTKFTLVTAGFTSSLVSVGSICANITSGVLSDRLGRRRPVYVAGFPAIIVSIALFVALVRLSDSALLYVISFLIGLSTLSAILGPAMAVEAFPPSNSGTAVGLMNAISWLGAFVLPTAVGFIIDATGSYEASFVFLVALLLLAFLLSLGTKEQSQES